MSHACASVRIERGIPSHAREIVSQTTASRLEKPVFQTGELPADQPGMGNSPIVLNEDRVELILLPENEGPLSLAFRPPRVAATRLEARLIPNGSDRKLDLDVRIPCTGWRVTSAEIAQKDRQQIESLIRERLLASDRYPELRFVGKLVRERIQAQVAGTLTLRGVSQTLSFQLRSPGADRWSGEFEILQTDFGIDPIKAFGGALRSANRIRARLEIRMA